MNPRRELFCCALALWLPTNAFSQPAKRLPRVAILMAGSPGTTGLLVDRFKQYMAELGWVDARNVTYAVRYADGHLERLPALAQELVKLKPDVIWTGFSATALAAHAATSTIPIVFLGVGDPVALGLAKSLAAPGGNVTGLATQTSDLPPKLLELLREAMPGLTRAALLWNPTSLADRRFERAVQAAAAQQRISIVSVSLASQEGLDAALAQIRREGAEAVILSNEPLQVIHRSRIDKFLVESRIAGIQPGRDLTFPRGALIGYGRSVDEQWRLSATYVDRILHGGKPAEMPIEQPTRVELVLNLRAAKAIGITVPPSLLLRADEVIE